MIDYFAFFELPRKFSIPDNELRRKYLQKSRETHPDFFVATQPERSAEMEENAALLNAAYRNLKDEFLRIRHILELEGIDPEKLTLPPAFLMEMMELNETIEEDGFSRSIEQQVQTGKLDLRNQLQALMQAYDAASEQNDRHKILLDAAERILCLRYFERLESR
jgi:molecular chaperone HscB